MNKIKTILPWFGLGMIGSILDEYLNLIHLVIVLVGLALIILGCVNKEKGNERAEKEKPVREPASISQNEN